MNRRMFVFLATIGLSGISFSVAKWNRLFEGDHDLASPGLLSQLCNRKTIHSIGKMYLNMKPSESNQDWLLKSIIGKSFKELPESEPASLYSLKIESKIHSDFLMGKTVIVNGWILSVTEARQCALFYLIHS